MENQNQQYLIITLKKLMPLQTLVSRHIFAFVLYSPLNPPKRRKEKKNGKGDVFRSRSDQTCVIERLRSRVYI